MKHEEDVGYDYKNKKIEFYSILAKNLSNLVEQQTKPACPFHQLNEGPKNPRLSGWLLEIKLLKYQDLVKLRKLLLYMFKN